MNTVRGLFGCEPDKYSTNILHINAGTIWDFYGYKAYEFPTETTIDLTTQGLWGYDQAGGPVNGDLNVYLIADDTAGVYGFIASAALYESNVTLPSGFSVKRKLPWAVIYNSSLDGIPNFHLTHWPMPFVTLTDAESSGAYCAIGAASSTSWTNVDVSYWLPDTARQVYLLLELRYVSSAASAYIRSSGTQPTGRLIGSVASNSAYNVCTQMIRVTSDRKFQYKLNSSGAQLFIYVLGYEMSDPS